MMSIRYQPVRVDSLKNLYHSHVAAADVLRLDAIHPEISGNKWFKLRQYIYEAQVLNKKVLVTFGGAYSNHLLATAAAAKEQGWLSAGIVRGEENRMNDTLDHCAALGMHLYFISRPAYKNSVVPSALWKRFSEADCYLIPEGGYGLPGKEGASTILDEVKRENYTHILAAVGTGTTLAGLVHASAAAVVTGISVLKNFTRASAVINHLLDKELQNQFSILHDYHFGGYARQNLQLFAFMNEWFEKTGIPSDFVYTGKLFFAADQLIRQQYFPQQSRILIIHSGGLQGNRSLKPGTLIF